jgi:hypothetical protein
MPNSFPVHDTVEVRRRIADEMPSFCTTNMLREALGVGPAQSRRLAVIKLTGPREDARSFNPNQTAGASSEHRQYRRRCHPDVG